MVLCTYGQPHMMAIQKAAWDSYPEDIQKHLQVIVIDDHGDPAYTCDEELPYELRIYRSDKNIAWNQPGAKNLGFQESDADWIINLDPDMVLSAEAMQQIQQHLPDVVRRPINHHYKLGLKHQDGSRECDHSSPNFYLVNREHFWKCGGYNEDFSGAKGYSDVVLHRILQVSGTRHHWPITADFYKKEHVTDAEVRTLDRSYKRNGGLFKNAQVFARNMGWKRYPATFQKRGYVRFPWTRVR